MFDLFGPKVTHAHTQLRDENSNVHLLHDHPERAQASLDMMAEYKFSGSITVEFSKGTREPGENTGRPLGSGKG